MILFKISEDLNEQEFKIVKEVLLSLNINYQETMIIDEYLRSVVWKCCYWILLNKLKKADLPAFLIGSMS